MVNKRKVWKGSKYESEKGGITAKKTFNITLQEGYYCDKNYYLEINQTNEITEEGLLLVGKLIPNNSSLPEFWLRWDEKAGTLDIDIHGKQNIKKDWNKEQNGYQGHHPEKLEIEGRHFKISIDIPQLKIFEGVLSFNLNREVKSNVSIGLSVNVDVISSANPKTER